MNEATEIAHQDTLKILPLLSYDIVTGKILSFYYLFIISFLYIYIFLIFKMNLDHH